MAPTQASDTARHPSGTAVRRVLGVDPGSLRTGWALLRDAGGRPTVEDCGVIRLPRGSFHARLGILAERFRELTERLGPNQASVEAPFHGANSRAALQLAHARGVVLAVLAQAGVEITEYAPATVKRAVAGHGGADKEQVRAMVQRQLVVERPIETSDVSDALAVALCHCASGALGRAVAAARAGGRRIDDA